MHLGYDCELEDLRLILILQLTVAVTLTVALTVLHKLLDFWRNRSHPPSSPAPGITNGSTGDAARSDNLGRDS